MNRVGVIFLILLGFLLVGCGYSQAPKVIDGTWNASLQKPDTTPAYMFSATLTQGSGSTVVVSNFLFTAPAPVLVLLRGKAPPSPPPDTLAVTRRVRSG